MEDEKKESFKVPCVRTVHRFRHKVKRPRIVSFRMEGKWLMAKLSCGHEVQYCRIPKWTRCYSCPVETIQWQEWMKGSREIPFATPKVQ